MKRCHACLKGLEIKAPVGRRTDLFEDFFGNRWEKGFSSGMIGKDCKEPEIQGCPIETFVLNGWSFRRSGVAIYDADVFIRYRNVYRTWVDKCKYLTS